MIIEFTGCSSAGKSQIILKTFNKLRGNDIPVIMGYDYILNQFGISVNNLKLKSLLIDMLLVPALLLKFSQYIHYYVEGSRLIIKRKDSLFMMFNILRNFFKQVAVFKFITKRNHDNIYILLDEGTVHIINNIFAHYNKEPDFEALTNFLPTIPMPDKIILINTPVKVIADRALKRKDPPWKDLPREKWETLAKNALSVFNRLINFKENKGKLFVVQNLEGEDNLNKNAAAIANFILERDNQLNECKAATQ